MELMQKVVREQKKTLVMVTHDQHLAAYADRIFHIRDGKILKIEAVSYTHLDVYKRQVPIFGLFGGIFVGCWSMALAEILNLFPIFIRRIKLLRCIPYIILGIALGKGIGAFIFFFNRW